MRPPSVLTPLTAVGRYASRAVPRRRRAAARPTASRDRSSKRSGLTKRYGGLVANDDIDFTVKHGELRGIIGPNGAGKTTFFKMLTCEVPPTVRPHRLRGPRHHRPRRDRRLPARPDQELPGQPALHPADGAREHHHRRARRAARQVPARPVARPGSIPGLERAGRADAGAGQSHRARRHAGLRARLWREAAARDRAGARHRARACCCSTSRSPA